MTQIGVCICNLKYILNFLFFFYKWPEARGEGGEMFTALRAKFYWAIAVTSWQVRVFLAVLVQASRLALRHPSWLRH